VDETHIRVTGRWVYLYRAVDQFGQVIDMYASTRRDTAAARMGFERARTATGVTPTEVVTDWAPTYPRVLDELWPAAWHHREQYANNRIEADHAQLKRRVRAMRGIKTITGLRVLAAGHAFVQNLRRGHYEIAADQPARTRLAAAFSQVAKASRSMCGSVTGAVALTAAKGSVALTVTRRVVMLARHAADSAN
jgi:transposase-like protein